MAGPPQLPEQMRRLHFLLWRALTEKLDFGEHLQWHASPIRRHEAARPKVSLAPPPATNLQSNRIAEQHSFQGRHGEQISYEDWVTIQKDDWADRECDPVVIDKIGVQETIRLAETQFNEVAGDYLRVWANGDSDELAERFDQLRQEIGREVSDLWRKDAWHTEWFDRACRNEMDKALAALSEQWKSRARRLEIQHLQNPDLGLRSLCAANGDLGIAHRFDERMLEQVREDKEASCANAADSGEGAQPSQVIAKEPTAPSKKDGDTSTKPLSALPECPQSATPGLETGIPTRTRRGPKPDYETALKVAEIVAAVAGEGMWRSELEEICLELDEKNILRPKTWKMQGYKSWFDCLGERRLVQKAISHHLELAKRYPKTLA